ncbi:hypothetical protein SAMN02910456_02399 [Ruminococcaceae bacterium YRB3002]|nr:hypothetical protein SAMN02910456_02399 [Ruminococcaceae bacterium YRB3002]
MTMRLTIAVAATLAVFAGLGGCSASPVYSSPEEVTKRVEEHVCGEKVEMVSCDEDLHNYVFSSEDRELTFDVEDRPGTMSLDGAVFGYYDYSVSHIYYKYAVYSFWTDSLTKAAEQYGFDSVDANVGDSRMPYPYEHIDKITIVVDSWADDKKITHVNDFLKDLRRITQREADYHGKKDYEFTYSVEILWRENGDNGVCYRTSGNGNDYRITIGKDTPDEQLDIRTYKVYDQTMADYREAWKNMLLIRVVA